MAGWLAGLSDGWLMDGCLAGWVVAVAAAASSSVFVGGRICCQGG